jgi:RecA-family ATPase
MVAWIESVPQPGLVVIDTFQRVRPPTPGRNQYAEDYQDLIPLHDIATIRGVAVVLVHHHRKQEDAADWIDALSGSTGLTAAVDTIMALFRERGTHDATLKVAGRDLEEQELALAFDKGRWSLLDDAATFRMETTRRRIIEVLEDIGPSKPKDISTYLDDVSHNNVRQTLGRMKNDGEVGQDAKGTYQLPENMSLLSQRHSEVDASDTVTDVTRSTTGERGT